MTLDHRLSIVTPQTPDADLDGWIQSHRLAFAQSEADEAQLSLYRDDLRADRWRLRSVHDTEAPALTFSQPIATFGTFDKTLSIGGQEPEPVTCITDVTVRGTHRRRGLLRAMMTAELRLARERGHAAAILTATEGTIYGRFGFGPLTHCHAIEIDSAAGFGLRTEPAGQVAIVDQETAAGEGSALFERLHREQFGSIGRVASYAARVAGLTSGDTGVRDRHVRNALHLDAQGRVDGWLAYRPEKDGAAGTVTVTELLAQDTDAYLGLWDLLGALDLTTRVSWRRAPVDDPLRWALADPRGYRITGLHDILWARVLDPVGLLARRGYAPLTERLTIAVTDPLELAHGTFTVEVEQGQAQAYATTDAADLTVDIEALGALILGGVDPRVLASARRLSGQPEALERARVLFGSLGTPWTTTVF